MKIISASLLALLVFPTSILASVGGRCSNNWGDDCICLDQNVCRNTWKGVAYAGSQGNYPCPNDSNNIWACIIQPCPTKPKSGTTQCLWKDGCNSISSSKCFLPFQQRSLLELPSWCWPRWWQVRFALVGLISSAATIGIWVERLFEWCFCTLVLCRLFPDKRMCLKWNWGEEIVQ